MDHIHRDDIPMEIMEGFVKDMSEKYPGMKVVCAGDYPGELPEEVVDAISHLQEMHNRSITEGMCIDCGERMPGYPEDAMEVWKPGWKPSEGWRWFEDVKTRRPVAWQCPKCDSEDEKGVSPIRIEG